MSDKPGQTVAGTSEVDRGCSPSPWPRRSEHRLDDGDLGLIRACLRLTPTERLLALQELLRADGALRDARRT